MNESEEPKIVPQGASLDAGTYLTKEQYDELTSRSYLTQQEYLFHITWDPDEALNNWNEIIKSTKQHGIKVNNNIDQHVSFWKRQKNRCFAYIFGKDDNNMQSLALLSKEPDNEIYHLNLLQTLAPVMQRDFIQMMVDELHKFAEHNKVQLKIPKRYEKVLKPLEAQAS